MTDTDSPVPEHIRAAIHAGHVGQVTIFCDGCGVEDTADYTGETREVRFAAARVRLAEVKGWRITEATDLCPSCPDEPAEQWAVRHPGLGVLAYDDEADARVAAGTAGTVLIRDRADEEWRPADAQPEHRKLPARGLFPQDEWNPECACGADWPCSEAPEAAGDRPVRWPTALRTQLLAALGRQDDGRTPLSEYAAALIADRDTMREVAEANKRNHGILVEAYQQLEADSAKLKATIDTYLATDERGVHDAANLAHARTERDALRQHILDIDAHATPYGDIPDEPGWIGTYLVTAGALHRALGKIGHSAPRCQAEADYELLVQAVDAQQSLRRSAEEKLIATHADLAAARRELATVAEQIAVAIEAKRGPGQSARYVAALTKAADIARQHAEVEPPESLPTGSDEIGSPDTWSTAKSSTEE